MTDKTLVSELEYLIDENLLDNPSVRLLVERSIKELKFLGRENARMYKQISLYMWDKYPDRMGS